MTRENHNRLDDLPDDDEEFDAELGLADPLELNDELELDGDAEADADWERWSSARIAALEQVLGPSDDIVGHALIPFAMGPEVGGAADVIYFRHHLPGRIAVTADLIGCDEQVENELGNYELMIAHRDDEEWGGNMLSQLAHYTLEAELSPGDTMDIEPAVPDGSSITALLFLDYARFEVLDRPCGLLLCMGLTQDELDAWQEGRQEEVEAALKRAGVFPYTDLFRKSVLHAA